MNDTIDTNDGEHPLESDYPDGETLEEEMPVEVADEEELAELEDDGLADPPS